jgi:hypothetical protein
MSEGGARRPLRIALTAALAVGLLLAWLAPVALAADGGLIVNATTRYQVLPEAGRVHVVIDAVATSFEPDTEEGRFYYSGITFAVPAEAGNIAAFSGGVQIPAQVVERTDAYQAVEVAFDQQVFFQESYTYTVVFDLVDPGGVADRDVRIGRSLVAFPVWAFGTDDHPGSSVRVELPAGFEPTIQGSTLAVEEGPELTILSAQPADPFEFFAYVSADRPGAFAESPLEVPMRSETARVTIRAWDDDPDWAGRTGELLEQGLPLLEELIGIDYPLTGRFSVEEAAISRLGEYAGIYDPDAAVIWVRYDADAFVTLHEAAHLWFNDRLLDGRWIGEAWAEFYSIEAGERMGEEGFRWELTADLMRSKIPLNDWGAIGRENLDVEDFAYAASYEVARRVADRVDLEGLRDVWQAATDREPAYLRPDGTADAARARLGQPGWQRLLDLLEERTGERFDDIWAEWIVNGEQQPLLAARASTRSLYRELAEEAADWQLPRVIRQDLNDWKFDGARANLQLARAVLGDRDRIADRADDLQLASSDRLQRAFEGDGGLQGAADLARLELVALADLASAMERLERAPSVVEEVGLLGSDPGAILEQARDDYEEGRLGEARRSAAEAVAARDAAVGTGRSRVTLAASLLLALDGLALSTASAVRLRRLRRWEVRVHGA